MSLLPSTSSTGGAPSRVASRIAALLNELVVMIIKRDRFIFWTVKINKSVPFRSSSLGLVETYRLRSEKPGLLQIIGLNQRMRSTFTATHFWYSGTAYLLDPLRVMIWCRRVLPANQQKKNGYTVPGISSLLMSASPFSLFVERSVMPVFFLVSDRHCRHFRLSAIGSHRFVVEWFG